MGVAVCAWRLGGAGGASVGGAYVDGGMNVAGEGGGEVLEAAASEAGDGAGGAGWRLWLSVGDLPVCEI